MNRFQFRKNLLAGLLTPFLIVACTSVQSSDLKTAGMTATMSVSADGTGASTASAQLNVDTSLTDFVALSAGDTLTATAGSQTQPMAEATLLGAVSYSAAFSGEDAAGTTYTIALNRTSDTSAPSSTVTMPAPFTISAPAASTQFSRANQDIVVTYGPSGGSDQMTWTAAGNCVNQTGGTLTGDPGTLTIAHATLTTPNGTSGTAGTCMLTVTISRNHSGTVDSHYQGGTIVASQTRTLNIQSAP